MRFRPCIDLHQGQVKQIVGATLQDNTSSLQTNFSSPFPPSHYASLYRQDNLTGGHVIMLGTGNEAAASDALGAWPGGLQIGGGITSSNAKAWLDQGASHVIVTSYVFHDGQLDEDRLTALSRQVGRDRLVLDLSCRWRHDGYYVVTDRWQKFTALKISPENLAWLAGFCDEFLIHAVDVEGKCMGLDTRLLELLAASACIPATYAGGVTSQADLDLLRTAGKGQLDFTVGSALDIFGGAGLAYRDLVRVYGRA